MNMYHKNELLNERIWIFKDFSPWDLYKGIKEDYMIHIFWARHDALTTLKREILSYTIILNTVPEAGSSP